MTADVSEAAQQLAGELADAFETDRGLAERLNACQHPLQAANDRLWSGLYPDALGLVYDGATVGPGASAIGEGVVDAVHAGGSAAEVEAALLGGLQEVHWAIHRAFSELIAAFVAALVAAGWSEEQARTADVHQFAAAVAR